jgi:glutaryl-CoA dehydrogenase
MDVTLPDLFDLDSTLSDEEALIRDTVRSFVNDKWLPIVADHYEAGTFPMELIPQIAEMGLLGMHLEGYGCAGTSALAYGVASRELERGDTGLRSLVSVQGSLAMYPIWKWGSEDQKNEWLPKMAAGEVIGCFGLTEPDHGSDPSSMKTVARRDGDDWIINGSKMWITSGTIAGVAIVWAQTDEGIRGFIVPTDTPGFEAREIKQKMSLRASATAALFFDDMRIPESLRLPEAIGIGAPLGCLTEARFGITFGVIGSAIACFEAAREYMGQREQFGKPISGFQLSQQKFADMLTDISNASLQSFRLAELKAEGKATPIHVSMVKRHNVRAAIDTARTARAMLGANGISLEYPVIRHMMNLESVLTYEGTEEIHTLVLGQAVTGISAFR